MSHELTLHPQSRCAAVSRIEVDVARPHPGRLALRYAVAGRIGDLRLQAVGAPGRADGLWRHTCFEAFVRAATGDAYYEFNIAPSAQWAAWRFEGYRAGMREVHGFDPPRVEAMRDNGAYDLHVEIDLGRVPDLPGEKPWRLGLSAVIEEADGRLSYWALAHPPGKPDFHHSDCFGCEVAPAWRP